MSWGILNIIEEYISELEGKNILVIGNLDGDWNDSLNDIISKKANIFRHYFQNCHLENGSDNLKEAHLSKNIDLVICFNLFDQFPEYVIKTIFENVLTFLKPGGVFLFSELCFQSSLDSEGRKPGFYNAIIQSSCVAQPLDQQYTFEILTLKSLKSKEDDESKGLRLCWFVKKIECLLNNAHEYKTFQEFLDTEQYSCNSIFRYERIFGDNFISTGGLDTTKEFVHLLNLKKDEKILDVGSGIGGSAFYMTQNYDVEVKGIDLSFNVVDIALERAFLNNNTRVEFEVCDATAKYFPSECFDVIYSRDTILHISDKKKLFDSFYKWIKHGGRLLISDYCCSEETWSEHYRTYVEERKYNLLSVPQYGKLLEEVGFDCVKAEDRSDQFVEMLKKEVERIESNKLSFLKDFSEYDFSALVNGWRDKLKRCAEGNQKWGLFYASKK